MTQKPATFKDAIAKLFFSISAIAAGLLFALNFTDTPDQSHSNSTPETTFQPLVMQGGDPYIRALMRTISASESNVAQPYSVLYGGRQIADLSRHPDLCVTILTGPNQGDCTTAAGRYQFITTTWEEKAALYHPKAQGFWQWSNYSFEPYYQDAVVYTWLKDYQAWGEDIPTLLRQGKLNQVLALLSGTWTSLGYGIETNSMSPYLPQIYQRLLKEELQVEG